MSSILYLCSCLTSLSNALELWAGCCLGCARWLWCWRLHCHGRHQVSFEHTHKRNASSIMCGHLQPCARAFAVMLFQVCCLPCEAEHPSELLLALLLWQLVALLCCPGRQPVKTASCGVAAHSYVHIRFASPIKACRTMQCTERCSS